MENKDKPAFGYGFANEQSHQEETGLTKREYFAGLALQGMLANPEGMMRLGSRCSGPEDMRDHLAASAIGMADELLKQLEK